MAYLIIVLIIVFVLIWATYMSKKSKDPNRKVEFQKARFFHRRYTRAGRVRIQSDEERAEHIMNTRDRYDPSIDRLDPHHKDYRAPGSQ